MMLRGPPATIIRSRIVSEQGGAGRHRGPSVLWWRLSARQPSPDPRSRPEPPKVPN
jgi:hypothetical protein